MIDAAEGNDELPGLSAFVKDETGEVFHSYSTYARGPEELIGTYMILDRAPRGRNETGNMDWMRRHDEYDAAPKPAACCASEQRRRRNTWDRAGGAPAGLLFALNHALTNPPDR